MKALNTLTMWVRALRERGVSEGMLVSSGDSGNTYGGSGTNLSLPSEEDRVNNGSEQVRLNASQRRSVEEPRSSVGLARIIRL